MFRFLELSLFGWDLWPPLRVPLDRDVVIVTGPNGSGKTTLLDAIRQVLNARSLSSRRRLQHYLRRPDAPAMIRAVVSNRGRDDRSVPFRRERIRDPEVTLACALVPGGGGAPEKRFAVLGGRVEPERLQRVLLDSRDWIGPERYSRVLEHAGVTRSLMGVLAIEQGRTNSLFELKPRELFRRVLDMLGDRVVLERYREARRRYEDTEQEVGRQAASLATRQAELQRALREVERLDAWERARDRKAELEARLPAAELQRSLHDREEAGARIRELTTKVNRGETEAARLAEARRVAEAADLEIAARLEAAADVETRAATALEEAARAHARAAGRVEELAARAAEAEAIPAGDLEALGAAAEAARRAAFEAEAAVRRRAEDVETLADRVSRLERGLPVWPDAVVATRRELERAGLPCRLLAETVEEVTGERAGAVEAALGDARYALLVEAGREADAVAIARRHRFPGPVWTGDVLPGDGAHGPLRLRAGAPAWLPGWLDGVELLEDGAWRDARGLWVAGEDVRLLGESGRREALGRARRERAEAVLRREEADRAAGEASGRRDAADRDLERERRRRRLLEASAGLGDARDAERAAAERAEAARREAEEARGHRERIAEERRAASVAGARAADEAERQARTLERDRTALASFEEQARRHDARIGELEAMVSPLLRERAREGRLDGADTVRADLDRAAAELAALPAPPGGEIREEARHLEANVRELERHVADRRREAEEAKSELAECRRRYLEIVEDALADYRRRVRDLAAVADVAVEMELPRLGDEDRTLDEAEIRVGFGFDGKPPLPLGDPSFSGGQQVIGGLVLLMGMAETDGEGFFMLDEPFAHLSLDRVDQVGRFLRGTRSQFILTAPTTLDRAQLDPASLLIALAKKRAGEPHAPAPVVAEAR